LAQQGKESALVLEQALVEVKAPGLAHWAQAKAPPE